MTGSFLTLNPSRKKCYNVTQPTTTKAASLQGLPNELQLKIIAIIFSPDIFASVDAGKNISEHCANVRRAVRCSFLGLVGVMPHFRAYFLSTLRRKVLVLPKDCQYARTLNKSVTFMGLDPPSVHRLIMKELVTVEMLIAYLETGDIRKLKKEVALTLIVKTSEAVKSALNFLRRSRN